MDFILKWESERLDGRSSVRTATVMERVLSYLDLAFRESAY